MEVAIGIEEEEVVVVVVQLVKLRWNATDCCCYLFRLKLAFFYNFGAIGCFL